MQESEVLQMSIKPLLVHCSFDRWERWGCTFPLPVAMTVIHVNRGSGPDGVPLCTLNWETPILSHDNFVTAAGEARGGRVCHAGLTTLTHGGGSAVASSSCVCCWRAPLPLQSSPHLDKLPPAADSYWQARSSSCVLTWTQCAALF